MGNLGLDEIRARIKGPVCSFATPFTRKGDIDEEAVRRIVDRAISGGSDIVLLTLGDSLFTILSDDEIFRLTKLVVEHVAGRALVVAADNMWWTGKLLEFAGYCRELGVDILMIRPPDWGKPTPESLAAHYAAAAEVMPVMLVGMPPIKTLEILANSSPGVVAFKEDMDLPYSSRVSRTYGDRWPMIGGGSKERHLMLWPAGVKANFSLFILWAPEVTQTYWKALDQEDLKEANRIVDTYEAPFFRMGGTFPGGLDGQIHCANELFGASERWRRPPYISAEGEAFENLRGFFQDLGLLKGK